MKWQGQYLYMTDIHEKCHKAMQFYDIIEKENSESSDSDSGEEEV